MTLEDQLLELTKLHQKPELEESLWYFSIAGADHPHIYAMAEGLLEAGAVLLHIHDRDKKKAEALQQHLRQGSIAESLEQVLQDDSSMVATSIVPNQRAALGLQVLHHNKHFFSAKAPFTTLEQLAEARTAVSQTGKKWAVFYSERLAVESAILAGSILEAGLIGNLYQITGTGPHRLGSGRPDWFFDPKQNGGILCDIGSHQIEQLLFFAKAKEARVEHSKVANYAHPAHPEWEDFGDAVITAESGVTQYLRVDWFTPDGLRTWGDGRTVLYGTNGYLELRKYIDVARNAEGEHLYLVTDQGETYFSAKGKVGTPYFAQLIFDCQHGTEMAMTQEHVFKAAELAVTAQQQAIQLPSLTEGRG